MSSTALFTWNSRSIAALWIFILVPPTPSAPRPDRRVRHVRPDGIPHRLGPVALPRPDPDVPALLRQEPGHPLPDRAGPAQHERVGLPEINVSGGGPDRSRGGGVRAVGV